MRVTMLLCDHAQVADNKLFINGAGWDRCTTPTPAHSVAILVGVPWDRTNVRIPYELRLVNEDGALVQRTGPQGAAVRIGAAGTLEVGRPAGAPPGSSVAVPLVVNVTPLALPADAGFEWRLLVDGEGRQEWSLPFRTVSSR